MPARRLLLTLAVLCTTPVLLADAHAAAAKGAIAPRTAAPARAKASSTRGAAREPAADASAATPRTTTASSSQGRARAATRPSRPAPASSTRAGVAPAPRDPKPTAGARGSEATNPTRGRTSSPPRDASTTRNASSTSPREASTATRDRDVPSPATHDASTTATRNASTTATHDRDASTTATRDRDASTTATRDRDATSATATSSRARAATVAPPSRTAAGRNDPSAKATAGSAPDDATSPANARRSDRTPPPDDADATSSRRAARTPPPDDADATSSRRAARTPPPDDADATSSRRAARTPPAPPPADAADLAPAAHPDPGARRTARRPLRPRREPLLAAHPAAGCALDPLEAVGLRQHERTRASLREFYWSDMSRFFETTFDEREPGPHQVDDPAFTAAEAVLGGLPAAVRGPLAAVARARVVDRLSEREFTRIGKQLAALSPAQVAALLQTDAPTLRAYVWTWLATTRAGGCHLGHLDLEFIEAAVADRSVAVEHGEDLVFRSLGDYALAARARLATLDPARFDAFLGRLVAADEVDPLVRATAHGVRLRRAHWDTLDLGLRDASAAVRAATAAAAIEMSRDKVEARLVEHAAADPADLVTEAIVGALLDVHDPHSHGRPQLRGLLASTRDERLLAAVDRWRGRGDPMSELPAPRHPLRFAGPAAAPVSMDMSDRPAPARPAPLADEPDPADVPGAHPRVIAAPPRAAPRARDHEPSLPGVRDDEFIPAGPPARP